MESKLAVQDNKVLELLEYVKKSNLVSTIFRDVSNIDVGVNQYITQILPLFLPCTKIK